MSDEYETDKTGTFTAVEDNSIVGDAVPSITISSGVASFNYFVARQEFPLLPGDQIHVLESGECEILRDECIFRIHKEGIAITGKNKFGEFIYTGEGNFLSEKIKQD